MKRIILSAAAIAALLPFAAFAQDETQNPPPGPPPGGPGGHRPPMPLMMALDTNKDGTLSADEIANASTSLKTLDKNGDGQLTPDELHGPKPHGGHKGKGDPDASPSASPAN